MAAERIATKTDLRELEQRLELRFAGLDRRVDQMVIRLGGIVIALAAMLFGALRLWPPH
jgi:hypothetical protein